MPKTPSLHGGWTRPPKCIWRHHNRRETSETTPHFTHLTSNLLTHLTWPFHLGSALDRCTATLLPIRYHPPAPHGPFLLVLPLPLYHSSLTPRMSAHSGSQWASFSFFSASSSGRGLNLTKAPSKTHAQSVAVGYISVGSPFYVWCATNCATAAALGFTP